MSLHVRLFAAAAEAAGVEETVAAPGTAAALREELGGRFGCDFQSVMLRCSLLSDGRRIEDEDSLEDGALVDVLPPFAGG